MSRDTVLLHSHIESAKFEKVIFLVYSMAGKKKSEATKMRGPVLSDRARGLLKSLVVRYIDDGQPVGSRSLSRDSGLELSPATIRNVMSDLEDLGLVRSPHTSAGRVPTVRGYRFFVDTLLQVKPVANTEAQLLIDVLDGTHDRDQLVATTSSLLSEITNLAGVVTAPKSEHTTLRQVEFLALSANQVLVILVVNEHEVQNRIINTSRRFSQSELTQAANYVTQHFRGVALESVRQGLVKEMQSMREEMNKMMLDTISIAEKAFEVPEAERETIVVAGQTQLMAYDELGDMEKLRNLFEAFNGKRDILHLLDQSMVAGGVQIFIGEESGYDIFDDCSVVTSTYEADGEVLGVVGVIGPTRMAYERVIPVVDLTAKVLGAALNPRN